MLPTNITQVNVAKVLNWIKHQVPTYILRDIAVLLNPCCKPTVVFDDWDCNWDTCIDNGCLHRLWCKKPCNGTC